MKTSRVQILAAVLSLALVQGCIPAPAFAASAQALEDITLAVQQTPGEADPAAQGQALVESAPAVAGEEFAQVEEPTTQLQAVVQEQPAPDEAGAGAFEYGQALAGEETLAPAEPVEEQAVMTSTIIRT